jgi:site-specific DNA-methyltransferase (adenine-specific)
MELNKIYHDDWINNQLPDKSVQLIIADPPYYKVKGDFDFVWKTFGDYLQDVERWAIECKRVLADNGTIYWYGDAKNIAYSQIIFDKYFNLLNSLVWENTNDHKQQIRFNTDLRTFAPLTERILIYSNERANYGTRDLLKIAGESISPFARLMKKQMEKLGITGSELAELQLSKNGNKTGWISNKLSGSEIPTPEQWELLCEKLGIIANYEELKTQREKEQNEWLKNQRPFNNERFYGDVIRIPNYETGNHEHDTPKPEKLTREIILISSRPNDLILVPFAGSGTECAMAIKENRNFIGFEINEKHVNYGNKRTDNIKAQPSLFAVS